METVITWLKKENWGGQEQLIGIRPLDNGTRIIIDGEANHATPLADVHDNQPYLVEIIERDCRRAHPVRFGRVLWWVMPTLVHARFTEVRGSIRSYGVGAYATGKVPMVPDFEMEHAVPIEALLNDRVFCAAIVRTNRAGDLRTIRVLGPSAKLESIKEECNLRLDQQTALWNQRIADALKKGISNAESTILVHGVAFQCRADLSSVVSDQIRTGNSRIPFTRGTVWVTGPRMTVDGVNFSTRIHDVTFHGEFGRQPARVA